MQNKIENIKTQQNDILGYIFRYYNKRLEEICNKYDNIYFVDISVTKDYYANCNSRPNKKRNELIIIKVLEKNNLLEINSKQYK